MKRSLLSRLRSNGFFYLLSALLLLLVIPLYQALLLEPAGFSKALTTTVSGHFNGYLRWIAEHITQFLTYRLLLIIAFALLLTLPFSLYRIIIAQELLGPQDAPETPKGQETETPEESKKDDQRITEEEKTEQKSTDALAPDAWKGKGFAVLAAWLGVLGVALYVLATLASTIYLAIASGNTGSDITGFSSFFTFTANILGIGLIGLALLFFGAMIARTGRTLWPDSWVFLGYGAIFIGASLCINAVAVAGLTGGNQAIVNTLVTFLFALWLIWMSMLLVRLRAEP